MARYKAKQSVNWEKDRDTGKKKIVSSKVETESNKEIKSLITILVVVVVIIVGIYFISKALVDKRTFGTGGNETIVGEIDYSMASVGMILNRPYDEYYVMVYNSEDTEAIYYSSLITRYQGNKEAKKIFYTDLENALNKEYVSETSNPSAQNTSEFAFGKVTLLHIKKGKVHKYIEDIKEIDKLLK